jgi:5-methyltetrahydropteroyltriglutamate--homocysteine methyltransferase
VRAYWPVMRELPAAVVGLDLTMSAAGAANRELLAEGPPSFGIGAGIVDARNTCLEDEDTLVKTILELARLVPPERLHVNPSAGLEFLPRERAQEKIALLSRAARRAEELLS